MTRMAGMKSLAWLVVGVALAMVAAVILIGPVLLFPGVTGLAILFAIIIWAVWPKDRR